ncbi:MAG: hypothetical protein ACTHKG_06785 [Nocardioides sp.]
MLLPLVLGCRSSVFIRHFDTFGVDNLYGIEVTAVSRRHERTVDLPYDPERLDPWLLLERVEELLHRKLASATGNFEYTVRVKDDGGRGQASTVGGLHDEHRGSRHKIEFLSIEADAVPEIEELVGASVQHIDFAALEERIDGAKFRVSVTIWYSPMHSVDMSVQGAVETDVVGMHAVLNDEIQYLIGECSQYQRPGEIQQPWKTFDGVLPRGDTPRPEVRTPSEKPAVSDPSSSAVNRTATTPWYNHPWIIGVGTAVIAGLIVLGFQLWWA